MVSLSDGHSFDDPIYLRTHFLGRVASEDLGIAHQKQPWSKTRTRQYHHDLDRWGSHWFQPLMSENISSDSSDSSDTERDEPLAQQATGRARASTLPVSREAPQASLLVNSKSLLKRDRSHSAPDAQLLPPQPLSINTLQPLRLSSTDLCALTTAQPAPLASSSRTSDPILIQYSESDGSCHGDAGDQDPEAQLAAGIIRLREQRRAAAKSRSVSRRRVTLPVNKPQSASDDGDSIDIQAHAGNFVLRLAEAMLDFGSAALEHLSLPDSSPKPSHPLPQRRLSTTPKKLVAETEALNHHCRRRQQTRSAVVSRNASSTDVSTLGKMARTLSMPRLLSLSTVLSPSASLKQLTMTTASSSSSPTTETPLQEQRGFGQHSRQYSGYGLDTYADVPSAFAELNSLDAYGDRYHSTLTSFLGPASSPHLDKGTDTVSPLWNVLSD